jgi:superfamily II DNA or RNA helicase
MVAGKAMAATPEFRSRILTRGKGPGDYAIYRAGVEWDLTDPIVIEGEEDFKSRPRWHTRLTPYHHQVSNLITFCRRLPVTLLADDVGLGKTISAGLVVSELAARGRLDKVLVVCPKILCQQWKDELATKFDLPAEIATGRPLLSAEPASTGAVITTYNSARLYLDRIPEDRFEMLILDEAHKLRNLYGVPDTPQVAKRFRQALEERRFHFVLMLTATPIHNRLWDLYSLVDLLTVARGHENPFGTEGMFARRFIADSRNTARRLRDDAKEEFRSIVYGYMSRVRRDDAKLYFPSRVVRMERVQPSPGELELIEAISEPIQAMNRLAQIGILQDLVSSPEAVSARLTNMARNGTAPPELAATVRQIVRRIPTSAKLQGLSDLVDRLKAENPDHRRVVIFTTRRETQTTIQDYLHRQGLKVGLINGDSAERNQETIELFRADPPAFRIIISTEAGSEGLNLQVANFLVNYDLPWNPMIVEQRIGRVQRLASEHAHVSIFNITLRGTFEEYIVGRLMEKLQMASSAIGDIEALLEGSDIGDSDDDAGETFQDTILALVLAALAGKDVEQATRLAEQSIADAKAELEREEAAINTMLGSMDGHGYVGPRAPDLPPPDRSMDVREFTLRAFPFLGAKLTMSGHGVFLAEENATRELLTFEPQPDEDRQTVLYTSSSPAFQRLVKRVIASGWHDVADLDQNPAQAGEAVAKRWANGLGAELQSVTTKAVRRIFQGEALVRVRATVAHDSYERIVTCRCDPENRTNKGGQVLLEPLPHTVEDMALLGVNVESVANSVGEDKAIAEFCRFYLERREQEVAAAGDDKRKRQKLNDEFTPRLDMTLAGLQGSMWREVVLTVRYTFLGSPAYETEIAVRPHDTALLSSPPTGLCSVTGQIVPIDALGRCAISGAAAMRHILVKSEISARVALPEFTTTCSLTGKCVLNDEAEESAVTGKPVASSLLMVSAVSGKKAEPAYFGRCAFTGIDAFRDELAVSEISGKLFRSDEAARSAVSGLAGHKSEFIECYETRQLIAPGEAERCDATGNLVRKGILQTCSETGRHVLPSELGRCTETAELVLKSLLVTSSISENLILQRIALRASTGNYCAPSEARNCFWSGNPVHPDDLRTCALSGLSIHAEFATREPPRLRPLVEILDGVRRTRDEAGLWDEVAARVGQAVKAKRCLIEAAVLSPARKHLAVCSEVKTLLGMRVRYVGAVFDLTDQSVVGRVAEDKRRDNQWIAES